MGEFRKYRPYYALNALRFNGGTYNGSADTGSSGSYAYDNSKTRVPNFRDIAGIEYGWLKNMASYCVYGPGSNKTFAVSGIPSVYVRHGEWMSSQYQPFTSLDAFATSDKLADYSIDDYDYRQNMVGATYFQRSMYVAQDVNKILYSMSIFNNNQPTYELNDNPDWAPDTYYELVDTEYVLLDAIPADWNQNYTTYYIQVPAADIKVSCIKFRNRMLADPAADRSYSAAVNRESAHSSVSNNDYSGIKPVYCLFCSYFLDEEVTIHPGDSYLLSLSFESSQF